MELPEPLLTTLDIAATRSENGAEMRGADRLYNYEQVLRQVIYTNQKPAYYLNRQFKLVCSELNERFVSNEYVQTVRKASVKRRTKLSESTCKMVQQFEDLVPTAQSSFLSSVIHSSFLADTYFRNDLFWIKLGIFRVPDPAPDPGKSSGTMRIRIHNNAYLSCTYCTYCTVQCIRYSTYTPLYLSYWALVLYL